MRAVIRMAMRRAISLRLRASMAFPSRNTVPDTLESWPIMVFNMVDFPEPLGPISVTILPRCTWRAMSSISGLPW